MQGKSGIFPAGTQRLEENQSNCQTDQRIDHREQSLHNEHVFIALLVGQAKDLE